MFLFCFYVFIEVPRCFTFTKAIPEGRPGNICREGGKLKQAYVRLLKNNGKKQYYIFMCRYMCAVYMLVFCFFFFYKVKNSNIYCFMVARVGGRLYRRVFTCSQSTKAAYQMLYANNLKFDLKSDAASSCKSANLLFEHLQRSKTATHVDRDRTLDVDKPNHQLWNEFIFVVCY